MKQIPSDFDWVSERAKWTPAIAFDRLATIVKRDQERALEVFPGAKFTFYKEPYSKKVIVGRQNPNFFPETGRAIVVRMEGQRITAKVAQTDELLMTIVPVLNDFGEQQFAEIDDTGVPKTSIQPMFGWQVSKRLLEDLFFSTTQ
jgi:hypothetical protein